MKSYASMSKGALIDMLRSFDNSASSGKLTLPSSSYDGEVEGWVQDQVSPEERRKLGECYSHADFYDFAPIGFVIFDARGVIREINLAGAEMLGRERSLLLNTPFISHIIKSDRKKFLCHLGRCKQSEGKIVSTISVSMERGNFFYLQLQSIVGRDLLRNIPFYLTALIDVSEIAELRSLAEGLTRNEETVRQFIAAELQGQVLGSLDTAKTKLSVLAGSVGSPEQLNTVTMIAESIDLAIRKVQSLERQIWPADIYATTLVCALDTLVKMVREEHNIPVEFHCDMASVPVDEMTRVTIFQVVREFLENAARYSRAKKVIISVMIRKGNLVVQVEDNGIGFELDGVMDPTRKRGGVGICNSKRRIENIGGGIRIDSAPNCGTRVTVLMPLKERRKENGRGIDVKGNAVLPERLDLTA